MDEAEDGEASISDEGLTLVSLPFPLSMRFSLPMVDEDASSRVVELPANVGGCKFRLGLAVSLRSVKLLQSQRVRTNKDGPMVLLWALS